MTIPTHIAAILTKKFGRALPAPETKVTLTVGAIASIAEAAYEAGRARPKTRDEIAADNIDAVLDAAIRNLKGKR